MVAGKKRLAILFAFASWSIQALASDDDSFLNQASQRKEKELDGDVFSSRNHDSELEQLGQVLHGRNELDLAHLFSQPIPAIWKSELYKALVYHHKNDGEIASQNKTDGPEENVYSPASASAAGTTSASSPPPPPPPNTSPLLNFEINKPAPILLDSQPYHNCTVPLMEHSFANSYGKPSVLSYSPHLFVDSPCKDPNSWTSLSLTLTGTVRGVQFDRLGTIWMGNDQTGQGVEVWRTDNPEPSRNGVVWQTKKDVGKYYSLFSQPADMVFDFPNIVTDVYTGLLNVTLSLTATVPGGDGSGSRRRTRGDFSRKRKRSVSHSSALSARDRQRYPRSDDSTSSLLPLKDRAADVVIPLSQRKSAAASLFTVGGKNGDGITAVQIPPNAARAVVEIYASGTALEEFWYTLLPDQFFEQMPNATDEGYNGKGPYREVQLHIDSQFAGFAIPYAILFTGGVNPLLWRPQASFGAFDQPTYSIDITPFLGLLTDGKEHEFRLSVVGGEKDGQINDGGWFVSGNVQVYLDSSGKRTTGKLVSVKGTDKVVAKVQGSMEDYQVDLQEPRSFSAYGWIQTASDATPKPVRWSQYASYHATGSANASSQINQQQAQGWTKSFASVLPTSDTLLEERDKQTVWKSLSNSDRKNEEKQDIGSLVQLDFSYPLYTDTLSDSDSFRVTLNQTFSRQIRFSSSSSSINDPVSTKKLIGNEEVLGRDNLGANWQIQSNKDAHAVSLLINGTMATNYGQSRQKFWYTDAQGGTLERDTGVSKSLVKFDQLSGSLAARAQPGPLTPNS